MSFAEPIFVDRTIKPFESRGQQNRPLIVRLIKKGTSIYLFVLFFA